MRLTKKGGQDMDTLKILVVDDESRMRKLVKDFLTKKNFQVLEAGDGEEAMDIFYKEKDIALIILHIAMTVENIHHRHCHIKLIRGRLSSGHVKLQSPLLELLVFCFQMFLLF